MGRRLRSSLVVGLALGLSACGGGAPSGSPSPAPSDAASSAASSPADPGSPSSSGSPSAALATLPADQCLTGTYGLVRFVAAGGQTYGTGEGGDLTVAFVDRGYTLTGAGRKAMELTLAGVRGQLTANGEGKGTYTLDGATATFTAESASGSGTLRYEGKSRRVSMDEVTSVVGLKGDGAVACTAQAMTITLSATRLELART